MPGSCPRTISSVQAVRIRFTCPLIAAALDVAERPRYGEISSSLEVVSRPAEWRGCLSPEPRYHPVMVSIPIAFSQRFPFPAKAVFRWATDYQPNDLQLMGHRGKRKIAALPGNAFVLTDTLFKTDGAKVTKKKLVRIFPDRLTWTNTHLAGPNRYSQVLYQLVAEGRNRSRLDFMGQHVEARTLAGRELQELAACVRRDDIAIWKNLAHAVGRDLRSCG